MAPPARHLSQFTSGTSDNISVEVKDACNVAVLEIFPDAEPGWLGTLSEEHGYQAEHVIARIADLLEDDKSYPKKTWQGQKRKRLSSSEDNDENMAKKFSGQAYRDKCRTKAYEITAKKALRKGFPNVRAKILDATFVVNDRSTFKTCLAVHKMLNNIDEKQSILKKNVKHLHGDLEHIISSAVGEQSEALEELLAAFRVDRASNDVSDQAHQEQELVADEQINSALNKPPGSVFECGCCFEEFASNRMIHCNGAEPHFFCRRCFTAEAERLVGLNKFKIECMAMAADCRVGFPRNQMLKLDGKLRFALERVEQDEAIREAGLENLETCPFCPYAEEYPPTELDKEFRCRNPDCAVTSCRGCRFETHIPKSCAEAAADNAKEEGASARHAIEEAMSAAMIRSCNKCKTPFIKEHGCNKMTCTKPSCRNVQCYVCHKSCQYNHFDRQSYGGRPGNCPLFDKSVDKRHQDEVTAAEESARRAAMAANPKLDGDLLKIRFSSHVEEDEKLRKLPDGAWHHNADDVRRARRAMLQARLQIRQANGRNGGVQKERIAAHHMIQTIPQPINPQIPAGPLTLAQHALVPGLPVQFPQLLPAQNAFDQQQNYQPYPQPYHAPPIFNRWVVPNHVTLPALDFPQPVAPHDYGAIFEFGSKLQVLPYSDIPGDQMVQIPGFGWEMNYYPQYLDVKDANEQQRPDQQHQFTAVDMGASKTPGQSLISQQSPIIAHGGQQDLAAPPHGSRSNPIDFDAGADRHGYV